MRGVSHQIAFFLSLIAGTALVAAAGEGRATWAAGIYAISLSTLLGISALYHRVDWAPTARLRMRRLDHAAIFLLIAGSYTPVCVVALRDGSTMLAAIWIAAAIGIVRAIWWPYAPKWLTASLYVITGWLAMFEWRGMSDALGTTGIAALLVGGVLYTVGAVVYAGRWPNPFPRTFGYHEIFHLYVIGAAVAHFAMIHGVVVPAV